MNITQSNTKLALKRAMIGLAAVAGSLSFALPAFAGVGGSTVPDYPSPVTAGATGLAAKLTITNGSTASNSLNTVAVTGITHTPSCGSTANNTCTGADIDTGVFTVHNGTGEVGTACAGIAFTAGAPDGSGKVTFTPGSPVTLGPSSGPLAGAQCIIDFTVDVLKVPTVDASAAAGVQTDQLGFANFQDQSTLGTGTGSGSSEATVNKASPSISTTPSAGGPVGTMLNDTATVSGGSSPTGAVTFKLFPPSDSTCAATSSYTQSDPSAPYATSPGFASNAAGVWHWTADYAGDASNNATSSGCAAEPVTVTPPKGHIIVDKVTSPSGDPQSFSFTAVGTGYSNFSLTDAAAPNDQALDAGTYSVSETVPAGWDQTSASCVSSTQATNTPASINLHNGETVTCTFTNTKRGHLIVDKVTSPSGDPTVFNITASGSGTITGGGSGTVTDATNKDYEVTPGTYSVSEATTTGWDQTSNTCSNVAVAAGQTQTCTITNTKRVVALQYCSPGYWKQSQHFDSYVSPYTPTTQFGSVFANAFPGKTLVQVLSTGGGGLTAYGRATVGALLNAAALNSGLTTSQVISAFNTTFANAPTSGNTNGYYGSANPEFSAPENCPLN